MVIEIVMSHFPCRQLTDMSELCNVHQNANPFCFFFCIHITHTHVECLGWNMYHFTIYTDTISPPPAYENFNFSEKSFTFTMSDKYSKFANLHARDYASLPAITKRFTDLTYCIVMFGFLVSRKKNKRE